MNLLTLSDAIANAYLFAGDAKTDSKGLVRVHWYQDLAYVSSYDDYIFIQQILVTPGSLKESGVVYLEKKALKEAGEEGFWALVADTDPGLGQGAEELFESLEEMLDEDLGYNHLATKPIIFPSDRFGKISRIKGDEPTKLELIYDDGMHGAKFTKGDVRGIMAFLEEE